MVDKIVKQEKRNDEIVDRTYFKIATVNVMDLMNKCAINKDDFLSSYQTYFMSFRKIKKEQIPEIYFPTEMDQTISVWMSTDGKFFNLTFNFEEMEDQIKKELDVKGKGVNEKYVLLNRVDEFSKLNNLKNSTDKFDKLESDFPYLHEDFVYRYIIKNKDDYNYKSADDLNYFVKSQTRKYEKFLDKYDDLKQLYNGYAINKYLFINLDNTKNRLYFLNKALDQLENCNKFDYDFLMIFLDKPVNQWYYNPDSYLEEDGKIITGIDLKEKYQALQNKENFTKTK